MREKKYSFFSRKVRVTRVLTIVMMICWIVYNFKFSRFYEYLYFYVDKSLPIEYQIIFYFSEEWSWSLIYLVNFLCLSVITMFVIAYAYHTESKSTMTILCVLLSIIMLFLFKTLWCLLFLVELLLAFSIFYIVYILTFKKYSENLEED